MVSAARPFLASMAIFALVIVRSAKPYNAKVEEEDPQMPQMVQDDNVMAPIDDENYSVASNSQPPQSQPLSQSSSGAQGIHPRSTAMRWEIAVASATSAERVERNACPSRYEEIIGYCGDSPLAPAINVGKYRCAMECSGNPDCLGFSFDHLADGKIKPHACLLQHTECRFPIYSNVYKFCRKRHQEPIRHHISPIELPPIDLPPIRNEEPGTEILRAYLSTYDQICDSDKSFKTTTVFTCAQYCLADAGCQAFSYEASNHMCRFIGHCQQKQVFKKLFGSSGMPDILSLLNFILTRATNPAVMLGQSTLAGQIQAAATGGYPAAAIRPPPPPPPPVVALPPVVAPVRRIYTSSEERYLLNRRPLPIYRHHHTHHARRDSREFDSSRSTERRALLLGFDRFEGDCQSPLLDNKVYELNVFDCARKCQRRADCSGFSVNLQGSTPHECYLRAESCTSPIASNAWVYYRKTVKVLERIPVVSTKQSTSHLEEKNDKVLTFYDFLQGNVNKTTGQTQQQQQQQQQENNQQQEQQKNEAEQQAKKAKTSRSSTSHDMPLTRRSLMAQPTNGPDSIPVPVPLNQLSNEQRQEKVLQYFQLLHGNCKGSVFETIIASLSDCGLRCLKTNKCLGFAYDRSDSRCFIKSNKCLNPEPSPSGVVYYQLRM